MSATLTEFDSSMTDSESFDAALDAAREIARLEVDSDELLVPHTVCDDGTTEEAVAAIASPWKPMLVAAINEPDADEVDGLAPDTPRHAQSFLFDTDTAPTFKITGEYLNDFDDTRVIVETPAPWEIPEDFGGNDNPNAIVKSLPWGEDDADEAEEYDPDDGAYHTFDPDDALCAPEEKWVIDKRAVDELRDRATAEGYAWDDARVADDSDDGKDTLDEATAFVETGDSVEVRYEKKNGNGIGTKAGEVEAVSTGEKAGHTQAISIRRDDGGVTNVRRDDDGVPAAFSNSRYPFMGEAVSLSVEPADEDNDGE